MQIVSLISEFHTFIDAYRQRHMKNRVSRKRQKLKNGKIKAISRLVTTKKAKSWNLFGRLLLHFRNGNPLDI